MQVATTGFGLILILLLLLIVAAVIILIPVGIVLLLVTRKKTENKNVVFVDTDKVEATQTVEAAPAEETPAE